MVGCASSNIQSRPCHASNLNWMPATLDRSSEMLHKDRLGQHYDFQSAQRLAQGRSMEHCIQSCGRKWFFKIDKMDQNSCMVPTVWSQLASSLFKEGDRIQVSLQGVIPFTPLQIRCRAWRQWWGYPPSGVFLRLFCGVRL